MAAQALAIWARDLPAARPYLTAATNLATPEALGRFPYWGAWIAFFPAYE